MKAKWIIEPLTIGTVTRYKVAREDNSESRGCWDHEQEARSLADLLNSEDPCDGAVVKSERR